MPRRAARITSRAQIVRARGSTRRPVPARASPRCACLPAAWALRPSAANGSAGQTAASGPRRLQSEFAPACCPAPAGSAAPPRSSRRTNSLPSAEKTAASRSSSPLLQLRPGAQRHLATALQARAAAPAPPSRRPASRVMVQRRHELAPSASSAARVSIPSAPWPDRGQHHVRVHHLRHARRRTQPIHARLGQHDRVEFSGVELLQPRVHVPAHVDHFQIRPVCRNCACRRRLLVPTRAPGGNLSSCGPLREIRHRADLRAA